MNKNFDDNEISIPHHLALIMDGNRRWARSKDEILMCGYFEGVRVLTKIVEECVSLGVKVLTAYSFSTENWERDSKEINL